MISALIAVLAAGIAFAGVVKTTGSARREARRKERIEVLQNGFKAVWEYYRAMWRLGKIEPQHRAEYVRSLTAGPVDEYGSALIMATSGLVLYGFGDILHRIEPFLERLGDLWEQAKKTNHDRGRCGAARYRG